MTEPSPVGGRYRLLERIGVGGMGRVWLADDDVLHRQVAIKEILLPESLTDEELAELRLRTLREARTAARLTHPNVVRVYDVIVADERPWIIMEYVASRSLAQVVRDDRPLTPQETARVGIALVDALTAAHAAGVLHRDIKPGNVLLANDGRVMLTDFGLATFDEIGMQLTQSGIVHGSPQFISPERALDGTSSPAADMWSLGATLYAAVEGRSPYSRPTSYEILAALATSDPDPMVNAGPLTRVLTGLLRRDPAKRMKSDEMRARLERIVNEPPSTRRRSERTGERLDAPSPLPPPLATVLPLDPISGGNSLQSLDPPSPRHRLGATSGDYQLPKVNRPRYRSSRRWRVATLIGSIVVAVLVVSGLAGYTALSKNNGKPSTPPVAGPLTTPSTTPAAAPSTAPASTPATTQPSLRGNPPPPPGRGNPPPDVPWRCRPMAPPGGQGVFLVSGSTPKGAIAPADFVWFTHPDQYRIALPPTFGRLADQNSDSDSDCFYDPVPADTRGVGVDQWMTSASQPVEAVAKREQAFLTVAPHRGYTQLNLALASCAVTCVDWEYRYTIQNNTVVHVLTRTFFEPGGVAYMVSFSTSEQTWASSKSDRDAVFKSFAAL
ncbi:MAG TPA: serine/threonine-protein kinase [Micromonosporaceae bacterium]|jgi:serine/threonine protein kinase